MLKPPTEHLTIPGDVEILASNGDIDKSEAAFAWPVISNVTVSGGGQRIPVAAENWSTSGSSAHLHLNVNRPGTYMVAASTIKRNSVTSRDDFIAYLADESIESPIPNIALERIRERYSKYAISYFQIGSTATDDYREKINYPIQIRLMANPATLTVGGLARLQVLMDGRPLEGQLVLGGYQGYGHDAKGDPINKLRLRTDENGRVSLPISHAGRWYAYLVHMTPVDDGLADYESYYATTLFDVEEK